ncbi:MAG: heavy metal translocating P-type ATPase, partial [Eubacteriales bacterium]|nr:heavy metal translocating P-type ATPase [Eubacteriales bacterium]
MDKEKNKDLKSNLNVTLNITGLDCAHCASVIEEKVSKMENIEECNLNFITKELKVSLKNNTNKTEEIEKIAKLIDSIEQGVKIKEKTKGKAIVLNIIGLDCAHCASVIEEKVSKMENIEECSLNFVTKELKVTLKNGTNKKDEIENMAKLIDSIESGVKIEEKTKEIKENIKESHHNKEKLIRIILGGIIFLIAL